MRAHTRAGLLLLLLLLLLLSKIPWTWLLLPAHTPPPLRAQCSAAAAPIHTNAEAWYLVDNNK